MSLFTLRLSELTTRLSLADKAVAMASRSFERALIFLKLANKRMGTNPSGSFRMSLCSFLSVGKFESLK